MKIIVPILLGCFRIKFGNIHRNKFNCLTITIEKNLCGNGHKEIKPPFSLFFTLELEIFVKTQNAKQPQDWEKVDYSYICVISSLLIALGILPFKKPHHSFFSHLVSITWSIFLTWGELSANVFSLDLKNLIPKMRAIGTTWVLFGTADKSQTRSGHMKSEFEF